MREKLVIYCIYNSRTWNQFNILIMVPCSFLCTWPFLGCRKHKHPLDLAPLPLRIPHHLPTYFFIYNKRTTKDVHYSSLFSSLSMPLFLPCLCSFFVRHEHPTPLTLPLDLASATCHPPPVFHTTTTPMPKINLYVQQKDM